MTLYMRNQEKREEGRAEERLDAIRKLNEKGCTKEFIMSLDYSEEEIAMALEKEHQKSK